MIKEHLFNNTAWIDLSSPTEDELREISEKHNIDARLVHELKSPSPRSKFTRLGDTLFVVFHFPVNRHAHKDKDHHTQEVDFIIGKNFVLTTSYDTIASFHNFSKQLEVSEALNRFPEADNKHAVFFILLNKLYSFLFDELYYMEDSVNAIEKEVFNGKELEMVIALSNASRTALDFKKTLSLHFTILKSLQEEGEKIYGSDFGIDAKNIFLEYKRISRMIENTRELVSELQITNNSLVATKQNEVTKLFTILAFVTFPSTLLVSLFGMNTEHMPIIGSEYDFWIIFGFVGFVIILMFIYFRYKKWL